MWPTSNGDRTLDGAEAMLVASALDTMLDNLIDHLPEDEDDETIDVPADLQMGIAVFDALTAPQRVAMLHYVAKHLLTPSIMRSPDTSAIEDATIAAIFSEIRDQVTIEIDWAKDEMRLISVGESEDSVQQANDELGDDWAWNHLESWRSLTLAAYRQLLQRQDELDEKELPDPDSICFADWDNLIDQLVSSILWDMDFELASVFLDEPPELAQRRRKLLGIDEQYFVDPPLDPKPGEARVLFVQARAIVARFTEF